MGKWILWTLIGVVAVGLAGIVAVTVWVQHEAPFQQEHLVTTGRARVLILYHPSRDAHFSDDISLALARGFEEAGYKVDRWTMTGQTPARPEGYAVIAIVSNTFFWQPDWPTQRYLARADLSGMPVVAIIGGGGNTQRAQAAFARDIGRSGARLLAIRSLWISRPNEPGTKDIAKRAEANRQLAMAIAHWMALDAGTKSRAGLPGGALATSPSVNAPSLVPSPAGSVAGSPPGKKPEPDHTQAASEGKEHRP